jgi:hypothetical protein
MSLDAPFSLRKETALTRSPACSLFSSGNVSHSEMDDGIYLVINYGNAPPIIESEYVLE